MPLGAWLFRRKVRTRDGVDPRVADALLAVDRARFLDDTLRAHAHVDKSLPTGPDTTTSQPSYLARVITIGDVRASDRVLEIGTGIGFSTAILATLAREVVSVERVESLADRARANLAAYPNARVVVGDGVHAAIVGPFDVVFFMAAGPAISDDALALLNDGGRLVAPIGTYFGPGQGVIGRLMRVTRTASGDVTEDFGPTSFNPLFGVDGFSPR